MAVSQLFDNVMESFTTTSTGTVTLLGAEAGSQDFSVVGNGNTTVTTAWAVDANDNPSGAWEVATGCTWTASGTTMSRGTLLASSTGSAISWAAGKKRIAQGIPALLFNYMYLGTKGVIQGLELEFNSTTVLRVKAGFCAINNKLLPFAQTDYTSGTTMKNLANSTVTLAANKSYLVYAKDASGTLEVRIQINDGSGDGNDPDFTSVYDYWESVNGPAERRIGKFWTDGSALIYSFVFLNYGRYRRLVLSADNSPTLLSSGTAGSYTSINTSPYINSDSLDYDVTDGVTATGTSYASHQLSIDGGTFAYQNVFGPPVLGYLSWPRYNQVPNTQSLKYKVGGSAGDCMSLNLCGVGMWV